MMHMHQSGLSCEGNASQGNAPVGARLNGTAVTECQPQPSRPITSITTIRNLLSDWYDDWVILERAFVAALLIAHRTPGAYMAPWDHIRRFPSDSRPRVHRRRRNGPAGYELPSPSLGASGRGRGT